MAKEPTNKPVSQKTATKKTVAQKTAAKKAVAKKTTTTKKTLKTSIVAYVDVGFGNMLYIRGEGADLSWEKGVPMKNISATEWVFDTTKASGTVTFKFLINDQVWSEGDDLAIKAGSKSVSSPEFVW
jgi:hypothetical protein